MVKGSVQYWPLSRRPIPQITPSQSRTCSPGLNVASLCLQRMEDILGKVRRQHRRASAQASFGAPVEARLSPQLPLYNESRWSTETPSCINGPSSSPHGIRGMFGGDQRGGRFPAWLLSFGLPSPGRSAWFQLLFALRGF